MSEITRQYGDGTEAFKNFILRGADYDDKFFKSMAEIDKLTSAYPMRNVSSAEADQVHRVAAATENYRSAMKRLQQMKSAGVSNFTDLDAAVRGVEQPFVEPLGRLREFNNLEAANKVTELMGLVIWTRILLLGASIPVLFLVVAFVVALTRSITRSLRQAVAVAKQVAAGDLTSDVDVQRRDEVGELLSSLKTMNESLRHIVGEVRHGTDTMANASMEIVAGNTDLSQRTEEQASSLEETASSIEELTATVKQNADNAKLANQLADEASAVATKGGEVVSRVVSTMGSINESSRKIVDIISVIDGIAFQTNILALNAAVEAARAGEQGRGFAVVAGEVRNLAQRSAAAAKEIKTLIGDSVDKVENGTRLVDEAGKTMQEIVTGIRQVTEIMAGISAASQEQRAGIEQVNQAIMQMDKVTQQNAALVEESAAAAESLQEQASTLAESVRAFKLHSAPAPARSTTPRVRPRGTSRAQAQSGTAAGGHAACRGCASWQRGLEKVLSRARTGRPTNGGTATPAAEGVVLGCP